TSRRRSPGSPRPDRPRGPSSRSTAATQRHFHAEPRRLRPEAGRAKMPLAYLMSSEELAHNPSPVREGDVIASKYKVEKVLGVGGMGVVVAATHVDLRQKVALKFLLPAAATSSELVERFLREARASVRLKGKHVAQVLDVGRLDNGCPYLVMEYLDGHDLSFAIKDAAGPMPVEAVATYILHACEGLAEAHALGIVHRDLKPG